ncbi:uncharacterized protein EHS24_004659 [Apiotrichum porosum]|uniref:Uncharacterized protein n=1 Tax=Apiotrichum porosum TaxID=105984 RepID=A0A427Y5N7_9TREE|nr:uncharacterized protein EHS24_004659 [Apiotrichum porosum]RSH86409.1 hypothetical protein EHS24_004659 [Apiotrichum porosum]
MPPKRKTPPAPMSPPAARSAPAERDRSEQTRAPHQLRDTDHSRRPSYSHDATPGPSTVPFRSFPEVRDEREYWVDGPWGWDTPAAGPSSNSNDRGDRSSPGPSALELLYRWLEIPGNWRRFHEAANGDERKEATHACSDWLRENGSPVQKSWIDCEVKLIDVYRLYNVAREEELATGFADDGRPRLGSLILSAEVSAKDKDDKAKHYSSGLLSHVGAQLNKICGGLDYQRLKAVFEEGTANGNPHIQAHPSHAGHRGASIDSSRERMLGVFADADRLPERNGSRGGTPVPGPGDRFDDVDMHMLHAPRNGYDPIEDEARDAALAAYRSTKARLVREQEMVRERQLSADELRHRAIMDLAKLAHEMDPTLRPIVAYRTALTMYMAHRQTLGE